MESIDKTALVWMLGTCVTIIFALIGYIFARQGKDIKENRKMLLAQEARIQSQNTKIQSQENRLESIKELLIREFNSIMKAVPREVELAVIKERK